MAFPNPQPVVSVLLSVKNGAAYLDAALRSLSAQSFGDFQILLIDNGSTDSTAEIVRRWLSREPRIKAFHWPDIHLGECLRRGAELVDTPFLARLDADDIAHPTRLERQLDAMSRAPASVLVGTNADLIDNRGNRVGFIDNPAHHSQLDAALRIRCPFVHSSLLMRTAAYRSSGGYRRGLNMSEDYDLCSRMAEVGEVANLPERLTSYRVHASSITMRKPLRMALTAMCVSAARCARAAGSEEPFVRGVPKLRGALPLLGLSREEARRFIRSRALRHRLSRSFLLFPLPRPLKSVMRESGHRYGPRSIYLSALDLMTGRRRSSGNYDRQAG